MFPTTPEPPKKSRNDLFSLDWSPVTPNVASRSSTPPASLSRPSPLEIPSKPNWRAEERERQLLAKQNRTESTDAPRLPPTPPSPAKDFSDGSQNLAGAVPWPSIDDRASEAPLYPNTPISPNRWSPPRPPLRADSSFATAGVSDNPVLDSRQAPRIRLTPTRDYALGEGRHATVYLGSFKPRRIGGAPDVEPWTLCATKRIFPDRESQVAGLGEAFILSKLATPTHAILPASMAARGSPHILKLFGVRDERDGLETVDGETKSSFQGRYGITDSRQLGLGRPATSASHADLRTASADSTGLSLSAKLVKAKWHQRRSLRRKSSFTASNLSPLVGSPNLDSADTHREFFASLHDGSPVLPPVSASVSTTRQPHLMEAPSIVTSEPPTQTDGTSTQRPDDFPRMLLLLEYCPFGHVLSFVRTYPERMSKKRWFEWARQLVAAVAWAHERNVLHADIKPQNVLIASDMTLRLADFGFSMFIPPPGSSLPQPSDPHGLGTPPYSSPEFVRPLPSPFGLPSDVFSLGVTLSVLISGHEPYENMRTVERMLYLGRGGYWEWEERRRQGGLESAAVSRAGSIRSVRSSTAGGNDVNGRSRAGSNASRYSLNAAQAAFDTRTNGSLGGGLARPAVLRRTDSGDSLRSNTSGRASAVTLAKGARRLLCPDHQVSDDEDMAEADLPATPTSASSFLAKQAALSPFLAVPPASPPLSVNAGLADGQSVEPSSSDQVEDDDDETLSYRARDTYPDGSPVAYFLNEVDVVPSEVRELLRAMTQPKEAMRPTAKSVLETLDRLAATSGQVAA